MKRRKFHSELFRREILPDEVDFFAIVYAELLYRMADLKEKNCSCMRCKDNLVKYESALRDLKEERLREVRNMVLQENRQVESTKH